MKRSTEFFQVCSFGQGGEIYTSFEDAARACAEQQRQYHVSLHVEKVGAYCPTCGKDWANNKAVAQ